MKRWKKISSYITIGVFFLLGGIEYAVILPTLYNYVLDRFHDGSWLYGMILSAFSFAMLFASPLLGYVCDRSGKAKWVVIFGNLFEIGGNFLYFAAPTAFWLLLARLLCGFGAGAGSAIFAQIARSSTLEDRTKVFSIAMMARQSGMLLGPALNVFLKDMHFKIGSLQVNAFTSPGIFMALLFLIHEVMMVFLYYDMPSISQLEELQREEDDRVTEKSPIMTNSHIEDYGTQKNTDNNVEHITAHNSTNPIYDHLTSDLPEIQTKSRRKGFLVDILREELIVLLTAQFVIFFNQTSFETLVIPLTEHLLGWGELANSVMYCLAGVLALLIFFSLTIISKKVEDRWLMVIGIILQTFGLVWCLIFIGNANRHTPTNLMAFIISTFFIISAIPFFVVSSLSLFSKLTDEESQGLAQGIRRGITCIATILGPLFTGGLVNSLYIIFGVMAGLLVFLAIQLFLSFNRLKQPSKQRRKKDRLPAKS